MAVAEVTTTQWAEDVQRFIDLMSRESASLWAQAEQARTMKLRYGRETARNLATEVGCSRGYIRELIGTANVFPDPAQRAQDLSFSHHRIAAFTDDPERWLSMAIEQQWSVQDLRDAIRAAKDPVAAEATAQRAADRLERAVDKFNAAHAAVYGQTAAITWRPAGAA
jgi:hypothetical protein